MDQNGWISFTIYCENTEAAMVNKHLQNKIKHAQFIYDFVYKFLWFNNMTGHHDSKQTSVSFSTQWPTDWTCSYKYFMPIAFPRPDTCSSCISASRVANWVDWERLQQMLELDYHGCIFRVSKRLHIQHLEINLQNFIVSCKQFSVILAFCTFIVFN
jgi:hypothetical protein